MTGARPTSRPGRRDDEARERRRKASLVTGIVGFGALFGGGIVVLVLPAWIVLLTIVMALGLSLLVVAFFLAPGSTFARWTRRLQDCQTGKE